MYTHKVNTSKEDRYLNYSKLLSLFNNTDKAKLLLDGNWGLERETQRVAPSGSLALTEHPAAFGDKLENPYITTDFSESQLELITPPFKKVKETYQYLKKLQIKAEREIGSELLWPLSMPPKLPEEEKIPVARFKDTREGREKEIYRKGLALRYGKKMQMISGIHFNFSLGERILDFLYENSDKSMNKIDFINTIYFSAARNYLRYRWLLIYLFGASPSIDQTYYTVLCRELKTVMECCPECCGTIDRYEQYATSLRLSRIGYSNTSKNKSYAFYNSLQGYITGLRKLLATESRNFRKLGMYRDGEQIQLNYNVLQKESEFYSSIRLKQTTGKGESQVDALEKRGVKYLEVRILDLNPFEKTGISLEQLYFMQVFMLFCLFEESKPITQQEQVKMDKNHHLAAISGRKPGLKLYGYDGVKIELSDWSSEIFEGLMKVAALMDRAVDENIYMNVVEEQYKKVISPELLPSARIIREMLEKGEGFLKFGVRRAYENKQIKCKQVIVKQIEDRMVQV
ncbi:MAG: glutamate--cysteine ligase [Bacillota bacterium]|nr:glutamate--cysteine ligase [Bacillota bacterium]